MSQSMGDPLTYDLLDPPDLPIRQSDLDAVRVGERIGQDIFDDPFNKFTAGLVLFAHDAYAQPGMDIFSQCAVHMVALFRVLP